MQERIIAGDTLAFSKCCTAYPVSAGWRLTFTLVPRDKAAARLTIESVASGSAHTVNVSAAVTKDWAPGEYAWTCRATDGTNVNTVERGQCLIEPDPATADPGSDSRSQARRALADAKQALADWTPTRRSYKVNGREQEFSSSQDVLKVIAFWQREVDREDGKPQGFRYFVGGR